MTRAQEREIEDWIAALSALQERGQVAGAMLNEALSGVDPEADTLDLSDESEIEQ